MGAFLGLTFGLTWLLDLAIYLRGGLATAGVTTILQLQMLLPAFSAIVLGLFFFRGSPIYRGRPTGRGRWFYYYFLALTVVSALAVLGVWLAPDQPALKIATSLIPLVLSCVGLLLLVVALMTFYTIELGIVLSFARVIVTRPTWAVWRRSLFRRCSCSASTVRPSSARRRKRFTHTCRTAGLWFCPANSVAPC